MNMKYVQFENTFRDLQECYDSLENNYPSELSVSEKKYADWLIELCNKISQEIEIKK